MKKADWPTLEEIAQALKHGDGRGIRIAILDSGVEIAHPALAGKKLRDDVEVVLENTMFPDGEGRDVCGHGTAVASLLWELAPEAEIGSFRVLGANLSARSALVYKAAQRAVELGYHILNCSFGCAIAAHLPLYKEWIDLATQAGVHVVAAAPADGGASEWPAHLLPVFATRCLEGDAENRHYFRGKTAAFGVGATDCRAAWKEGSHRRISGSSFAAARMSALVARVLSQRSDLPPLLLHAAFQHIFAKNEGS